LIPFGIACSKRPRDGSAVEELRSLEIKDTVNPPCGCQGAAGRSVVQGSVVIG
jgi:hypothetical protein